MGKILSITEKVPKSTTLPDGVYTGKWGGHIIQVYYEGKTYELTTDEGVRGMNINVIVTLNEGNYSFIEAAN